MLNLKRYEDLLGIKRFKAVERVGNLDVFIEIDVYNISYMHPEYSSDGTFTNVIEIDGSSHLLPRDYDYVEELINNIRRINEFKLKLN